MRRSNSLGRVLGRLLLLLVVVGIVVVPAPAVVNCFSSTPRGKREVSVEQLDPETGSVLAVFPSIKEASQKTNTCYKSIQNVLAPYNQRRLSDTGFFWRRLGENTQPKQPVPLRWQKKPVEQVCVTSGQVLAVFPSIAQAAKAVNCTPTKLNVGVRGTKGSVRTCKGYFWRYKGSNAQLKWRSPVEQICLQTGQVLKTFATTAQAAKSVNVSRQRMQQVVNTDSERVTCGGYFWRFVGSDRVFRGNPRSGKESYKWLKIDAAE